MTVSAWSRVEVSAGGRGRNAASGLWNASLTRAFRSRVAVRFGIILTSQYAEQARVFLVVVNEWWVA